jgi:hypothetical protein
MPADQILVPGGRSQFDDFPLPQSKHRYCPISRIADAYEYD